MQMTKRKSSNVSTLLGSVIAIAYNVFALGEEADLTAQKMKVAQMFNTPPQLNSSTSAAFLPIYC